MFLSVIRFDGRLGNQMFQYAFFRELKMKHPLRLYIWDINNCNSHHHGFELFKIFSIKSKWRAFSFNIIYKFFPKIIRNSIVVEQPHSSKFYPELFRITRSRNILYKGFWQSESYFSNSISFIEKQFKFNECLLNEKTYCAAAEISNKETVSIHVRRGDYLVESWGNICDLTYYNKAIHLILERYPHALFVFFSDDIDWVKAKFNNLNAMYIDWNTGNDSWQDMYLISQCKHNIIANSTFSWWGAWLNRNPEKIVISPRHWFQLEQNEDIVPQSWIKI